MRIVIAQMSMAWTVDENAATVERYLAFGREHDAELVVFPELTLSGYHFRLPELISCDGALRAVKRLAATCGSLKIGAIVGAPMASEESDAPPWNAIVVLGRDERIGPVLAKVGLTDGEQSLFTPGRAHTTFELLGESCATLICREILDESPVRGALEGATHLFWPGLMRHGDVQRPDNGLRQLARRAQHAQCHVYHANWPSVVGSDLAGFGQSHYIDATDGLAHVAPAGEPGAILCWQPPEQAWIPEASLHDAIPSAFQR